MARRGKRIVTLDANKLENYKKLIQLLYDASVFLQGFRPGALDALRLCMDVLRELNLDLIAANLSAFGKHGPSVRHNGMDSIVQTCSEMNIRRIGGDANASPGA
ncbi:hypothetical protein D0862_13488 [Hortaea werneckii]|uniref:Uncharacterized protein n=1 Tax=Hortaea werneckii TaxID=91943 RepID=A0A3M7ENK0_HORWE|nr:hypothetical protein D0862_13488 [Hortaea werneckii]